MREADANLPFPPLTPPNEIVGGVFGNPKHDQLREDFDTLKKDAKLAYEGLWEQINGEESWAANPWVWVVDFRRVEK